MKEIKLLKTIVISLIITTVFQASAFPESISPKLRNKVSATLTGTNFGNVIVKVDCSQVTASVQVNQITIKSMSVHGTGQVTAHVSANSDLKSLTNVNNNPQYYIANDLLDFVSKPKKSLFKHHSWKLWTIPMVLLFTVDKPVTEFYENDIAPALKKCSLMEIFNINPDHALLGFVNYLYIFNTSWKNKGVQRFVHCASEAILDAYLVSMSLKFLTGRARPFAKEGPHSWGNIGTKLRGPYTDFPSTHATVYHAFWTIVGQALEKELLCDFAGALSYYVLVKDHNHWMSSMFTGYLLGKAIGKFVWEKNKNQNFDKRWYVYPFFTPWMQHPGIGFGKVF